MRRLGHRTCLLLSTAVLSTAILACAGSSSSGSASSPGDASVPHADSGVSALGLSCSGASPSFGTDVQPILSGNCASESCHGQWGSASARQYLVNWKTTQDTCASAGSIVVPGDIDRSYIFNKLLGVGMCPGTKMMPGSGGKLADKDIQTIVDWVCQGAN